MALSGLGAVAAAALWALVEGRDAPGLSPSLYLALFTFIATYAGVALALAGPVSVARALKGALLIALPLSALVSLAGARQVVASDLLDQPVLLTVIFVLILVATPFLLVRLETPGRWCSYYALFDAAWTMSMRCFLALVFVGVFWLVVFLSNALFGLVGVGIIEWLLDTDWMAFALSGAMLGLGLAVVYELRRRISPLLILRLLRLLVPVVLVVLLVFLGALPFRGLSGLFGEISAGATLMGAAIVAIILISSALDRDDTRAVHTTALRAATRGLALLLPLLAALAAWAVVLRVRQYGWTPDRMLAATVAAFLLAYGGGYALAALRRHGWAARLRQVNVVISLAIIGVSALWLTPVLDPYRISSNSQLARFQSGQADLGQLPFWALQNDWGKSGRAALARLEAMTGRADQQALRTRISAVREQTSKYRYREATAEPVNTATAQGLAEVLVLHPKGTTLRAGFFDGLPGYKIKEWMAGCTQTLSDGRPGCVFISGDYWPDRVGSLQGILLYLTSAGKVRADFILVQVGGDTEVREVFDANSGARGDLPAGAITQALDGSYDIRPSGAKALFIGDAVLTPGN